MTDNRAGYIQGLREIANFLEQHPEVKTPSTTDLNIFFATKDEVVAGAKAFGNAEKQYDDNHFWLKKFFSGGLSLEFFTRRETVCERVQVREETIPERIIPATEEHIEPSRIVPVYEWRCSPLLAPESEEVQP